MRRLPLLLAFAAAVLARPAAAGLTPCNTAPIDNWPASPPAPPCFIDTVTPLFSQWETLGVGARPLGMGGAFGAIADEASAEFWNPAGLAHLQQYEITAFTGDLYLTDLKDRIAGPPDLGMASIMFPLYHPQLVIGITYQRNLHTNPDLFFQTPAPGTTTATVPLVVFPYLQEDALIFSFASPFTFARGLSVGVNAKYYWYDHYLARRDHIAGVTGLRGYSADMGFLWKTPLVQHGKELSLGLTLTDGAGQIRWGGGLQEDLPPVLRFSMAYKVLLLREENTVAAFDLDQVASPQYSSDTDRKLRLGVEQWFFDNTFGVRAGYVTPFGYPGFWTVGASLKWEGLEFDYAFRSGDVTTPDHIPQSSYFQLTYRFGPKATPEPPKISAKADPRVFTPRDDQTTQINLKCEDEVPVDRWAVAIYDKFDRMVRSFSKPGTPPGSVTWGGEDSHYQLLPDGEYTYSFKVRDVNGRSAITAPQRVYLTSPLPNAERDPTRLFMMMDDFQNLSDKEKEAFGADAKKRMDDMVKANTTPTAGPGWTWQPIGPALWGTGTPGPAGTPTPGIAAFNYPAIPNGNMLDAFVASNPDNSKTLALDYLSTTDNVKFVLNDVVQIARGMSAETGPAISNVDVRAHYGDNVLRVNATADSTRGLAAGRVSPADWLRTAFVTVNGQQITPSF